MGHAPHPQLLSMKEDNKKTQPPHPQLLSMKEDSKKTQRVKVDSNRENVT